MNYEACGTFSASVSKEREELRGLVDFLKTTEVNQSTYQFLMRDLQEMEERLQRAQAKFDLTVGV